jgi:hypothetical protein
MEATSTRHATSSAAQEALPGCPQCGATMIVRAQWNGDVVQGLQWSCRRAPGCSGTRRIKTPDSMRPIVHDGSAQAIFDWLSARDRGEAHPVAMGGLRGLFGRSPSPVASVGLADYETSPFAGLVETGFVVLDDRRLPAGRLVMHHVLIGPSGMFVVERKSWPGQMSTTSDSIYVDGRERPTATDDVERAAVALDQTLAHELKPLGANVRGALLLDQASNKTFEGVVGKVLVGGTRGLSKQIRGTAEPILGPETIVRLALAADRLLD